MMVGSGIAVWNLQSEGDEFAELDKFVAVLRFHSSTPAVCSWSEGQSKCKPIYDRWVMQYGINHGGWPQLPPEIASRTSSSTSPNHSSKSRPKSR